jgi:uncharacterized protein with HEPN domain
MPLEQTDLKYIWDMLDAAKTVVELTQGRTLDEYERTKWLRLAVERSIEIIGEAARRVSDECRAAYPAVPWSVIVATRHVMAHEYGDLQHDKVLRIATTHVPALIAQLQPIIDAHPIDDLPGSNA